MVVAVGGPLALVQVGLVLLGLTALAVVLRRRIERGAGSQAGRVVRLTPQHAVHTVELEGRVLLIGTGPSGPPSILDVWPNDASATTQESPAVPRVHRRTWGGDG